MENNSNTINDYYKNGQIRIEKIINGDSAVWKFRNEDGSCWEDNYYFKNEKYKVISFYPNCKKQLEYELKNGKRHGKWEAYYENEKVSEAGRYENGLATGIFQYYSNNGQPTYHHLYVTSEWANSSGPIGENLTYLKKLLETEKVSLSNDIEVAGNKEFYFPVLQWKNSVINFDEKTGIDSTTICRAGTINDKGLKIMDRIEVGMTLSEFFEITQIPTDSTCRMICIYSTNEPVKEFIFKFYKGNLQTIQFNEAQVQH